MRHPSHALARHVTSQREARLSTLPKGGCEWGFGGCPRQGRGLLCVDAPLSAVKLGETAHRLAKAEACPMCGFGTIRAWIQDANAKLGSITWPIFCH